MPGVLQPDMTSRENIRLFLESIEDVDLKKLVQENLDQIIKIGAERGSNESFFVALKKLIEDRVEGMNENQED